MTEVEVYYFENRQFKSRQQAQFETGPEASTIFAQTKKKFLNSGQQALICIRSFDTKWHMVKSEKVNL